MSPFLCFLQLDSTLELLHQATFPQVITIIKQYFSYHNRELITQDHHSLWTCCSRTQVHELFCWLAQSRSDHSGTFCSARNDCLLVRSCHDFYPFSRRTCLSLSFSFFHQDDWQLISFHRCLINIWWFDGFVCSLNGSISQFDRSGPLVDHSPLVPKTISLDSYCSPCSSSSF